MNDEVPETDPRDQKIWYRMLMPELPEAKSVRGHIISLRTEAWVLGRVVSSNVGFLCARDPASSSSRSESRSGPRF